MLLAAILLPFALAFLISPLVTFLHEMGHALVGLMITREKVIIQMGGYLKAQQWRRRFQIGRLEIRWVTWRSGFTGFCYTIIHKKTPIFYMIVFTLAGPMASLILSFLLLYIGFVSMPALKLFFWAGAGAAFAQFLMTAIPMHYPRWMGYYAGKPSDGATALMLLSRARHIE